MEQNEGDAECSEPEVSFEPEAGAADASVPQWSPCSEHSGEEHHERADDAEDQSGHAASGQAIGSSGIADEPCGSTDGERQAGKQGPAGMSAIEQHAGPFRGFRRISGLRREWRPRAGTRRRRKVFRRG